jgi:hypothetical protein
VFCNLLGAAEGALMRAAASTLTLRCFLVLLTRPKGESMHKPTVALLSLVFAISDPNLVLRKLAEFVK